MLDGMISGIVAGSAYAIIAVSVVVLHQLVGIVNLSQAAIGALGAYSAYALTGHGVPLALAVAAGIIVSGGVAAASGWAMSRWFDTSSDLTRTVVTVTLLILFLTLGFRLFGNHPRTMPSLVPDWVIPLGGVNVPFATIVAIAAVILFAGAVTALLRFTNIGLRLRAISEQPRAAQGVGINAPLLTLAVWTVTGMGAAVALLLIAPSRNPTFGSMALLIVPALAAGLLGALTNVWLAAAGGILLGALEGVGARIEAVADYRDAIPFLIIIVALIWLRRKEAWDAPR